MDPNAYLKLPNISLCKWCREDIKPGAILCKHCGRDPRPTPPCRLCGGDVIEESHIKECPTWATAMGWICILLGLFGSAFIFGIPVLIAGICLLSFVREPVKVLRCTGVRPNGTKCLAYRKCQP